MATALHPPGPKGHVLLGNLPEFWTDPLGTTTRWAREYGDITRVRFVHVTGYFLNHPDYIEYVLLTNHRNFIKGRAFRASRALWETDC